MGSDWIQCKPCNCNITIANLILINMTIEVIMGTANCDDDENDDCQ